MYFVCSYSKKIYNNIKKPITFSDIGKPLEVRYNWEGVKKDIDVDESQKTLWRYRSVLPKVNNIISLGEGYTPLQQLAPDLYVKNETDINKWKFCYFMVANTHNNKKPEKAPRFLN